MITRSSANSITGSVIAAPMIAAVVLTLGVSAAVAMDGRIPIHQPTTITAPGSYVITRSISSTSAPITVAASDVDIDLNGFTLTRQGTGAVIQIQYYKNNVTISNGTLFGGSHGIDYWRPASTDPGLRLSLRRLRFVSQSSNAIRFGDDSPNPVLTVRDCEFFGSGSWAIHASAVQSSANSMAVTIADCVFRDLASLAIGISDCASANVVGNLIDGFNRSGTGWSQAVFLEGWAGATFAENVVVNPAGTNAEGVRVESGSAIVRDNVLVGNGGTVGSGLTVTGGATDCLISGNKVSGYKNGLNVWGSRHLVVDNVLTNNTNYGILWSTDGGSAYRDNMLRGNGLGATGGPSTTNTDAGGNVM